MSFRPGRETVSAETDEVSDRILANACLHTLVHEVIRIVVADHHVQTLAALKMMLQEQQDMVLVGESGNGEELLELAASCEANVILVDRTLPGFALAELLTRLHALPSSPFVIVMGSLSEHGRSALRAGADAFVSKSDDPRWLLECIPGYSSGTKK